MSLITPLHDVVCSLLEKPFMYWKERDQIDVINIGRPTVSICKIRNSSLDQNSRFLHFKKIWYYRFEWLCGSTYLQNLHCWPCLLFANDSKKWVCDQYADCNELSIFEKHAKEESHRICCKKLQNFDKRKEVMVENIAKRSALQKLTSLDLMTKEGIRLNRKCAQFAIDAILFMIKNLMPLQDKGNHSELVHLLMYQNSDEDMKEHYRRMRIPNPILSAQIQTAIVESLSYCIEDYIKEAINEAQFFSLRIDDGLYESTDCSIFLRCIKMGELKEYFLGSYSLGTDKTSLSLFRIVDSLLETYQYKSKLIGISYDITSVKFNYLKDLRVGLKFMAQQAIHVNLLSHNLDYLLERCLYTIPTCRMFFSNLSALLSVVQNLVKKSYFGSSSTWRDVINIQNPCCSKLKFLSAIVEDFLGLKNTLQEVMQDLTLSEEHICLISNMLVKLKDFEFVFLIVFFNHLFQLTDGVYQHLRTNPLDPKFCHGKVKDVCVTIYRQRNESFYNNTRSTTTRIMTQQSPAQTSPVPIPESFPYDDQLFVISSRKNYKPLYYEIIDNVIMELHTRYENVDQYAFFDLADSFLFETHVSLKYYTEERLHNLLQFYPELFKRKTLLFNELLKVTKNRRYWKLPILRILHLIIETRELFIEEAYKLFCLIALLTPTNQEFPCLHKFGNYLKNANANQVPHLAKILMNQDALNVLNGRYSFKDELLNRIALNYDGLRLSNTEKPKENLDPLIRQLSETAEETYRLYEKEGRDVNALAFQRVLPPSTIVDHLIEAIKLGLPVAIEQAGVTKEIFDIVSKVIRSPPINSDVSRLTPIKQWCPDYVEFNHIKVVIAVLQTKFGANEIPPEASGSKEAALNEVNAEDQTDAGPSILEFSEVKLDHQTDTGPIILGLDPNLIVESDMVVELDPTEFVSNDMDPSDISEPGPSSRMEPDSSVMGDDVHLAMTCEVFPVTTEPDSQWMNIKIKEEPQDSFRQDILSATVERELSHFSKDAQSEDSLFAAPILIKEEPVSSEEEL